MRIKEEIAVKVVQTFIDRNYIKKELVKEAWKKAIEKCYVNHLTIQFDVLKEFEKELGL